jgi:hypothetical protein
MRSGTLNPVAVNAKGLDSGIRKPLATGPDQYQEAIGVSKVVVVGRAVALDGAPGASNVNADDAEPEAGASNPKAAEAGAAAASNVSDPQKAKSVEFS